MDPAKGSGASVSRLVTFADLDPRNDAGPDAQTMYVRARLDALLEDGRRVVLLDDRGWTSTVVRAVPRGEPWPEEPLPGAWATATAEEVERTARTVVGPDEPFGGRTREDMEAGYWYFLTEILRRKGVDAEAADLQALPHEVELGERLQARLASRQRGTHVRR